MTFGHTNTLRRSAEDPELSTNDVIQSITARESLSLQNGGNDWKGRRAAEIFGKSR